MSFPPPQYRKRRSDVPIVLLVLGAVLLVLGASASGFYVRSFDSQQRTLARIPGACAKDYLSSERFSKMLIEVDHDRQYPPNATAFNQFIQNVERYVDKTSVTYIFDDAIDQANALDPDFVEAQYRDQYSGGDTAVLYILYIGGKYSGNEEAAGVTYSCSSIAVYMEPVFDIIPAMDTLYRSNIETNILFHEFGHVIGLVNELGYNFGYDQEDVTNANHNKNKTSVMYYMANKTLLKDFDAADAADLNMIRGLPYPSPNIGIVIGLAAVAIIGLCLVATGALLLRRAKKEALQVPSPMPGPLYGAGPPPVQAWHSVQPFPPPLYGAEPQPARPQPQYQAPAPQPRYDPCPYCGHPLMYVPTYSKWFCQHCEQYL